MSKDMVEQLKLAHKVVDVEYRADIKIYVTVLRYLVDKPATSYAPVPINCKEGGGREVSMNFFVQCKLEFLIYLLDVMNFLID